MTDAKENQDQEVRDAIWGKNRQGEEVGKHFTFTPVSYTNWGLRRRWIKETAESVFGEEYRHWRWDEEPVHQEVFSSGAGIRQESGTTLYSDGSSEEWITLSDSRGVSYHGHIMDRVWDDGASEVDLRKRELRRADPSGV